MIYVALATMRAKTCIHDNGREALDLVRQVKPDILLTDIEMPEMTGLELAQKVRDERGRPRVVILTTFARPGYLRRALDAGASGYLLKDSPSGKLGPTRPLGG